MGLPATVNWSNQIVKLWNCQLSYTSKIFKDCKLDRSFESKKNFFKLKTSHNFTRNGSTIVEFAFCRIAGPPAVRLAKPEVRPDQLMTAGGWAGVVDLGANRIKAASGSCAIKWPQLWILLTNNIWICESSHLGDIYWWQPVWPEKNRQMSIKVAQKWFH